MRQTASERFPSKFNPFIKLGLEWVENNITVEGWMAGPFLSYIDLLEKESSVL